MFEALAKTTGWIFGFSRPKLRSTWKDLRILEAQVKIYSIACRIFDAQAKVYPVDVPTREDLPGGSSSTGKSTGWIFEILRSQPRFTR